MTHEELKRATWLVKNIRETEQNANQDMHVSISGYGGWSMSMVPEINDALDEIQLMADNIIKAQARAALTSMKAELLALGVEA